MKNVFKKTIRRKYLVALEKLALMLFLKPGLHIQGNVTIRRSSIKFTDHYLSLTSRRKIVTVAFFITVRY